MQHNNNLTTRTLWTISQYFKNVNDNHEKGINKHIQSTTDRQKKIICKKKDVDRHKKR